MNQAKVPHEKTEREIINESKIVSDAVFRYRGSGTLEVKVAFGSRKYLFSEAQPQLSVFAEDVAMLRGFPGLVEVKLNGR